MSATIDAFLCGYVFFSGVAFIGYMIADVVQFTRAMRIVHQQERYTEYFAQPKRLALGSGFRLFRHFSKPPTQ